MVELIVDVWNDVKFVLFILFLEGRILFFLKKGEKREKKV